MRTVFTGLDRPVLLRNAQDGTGRIFIVEQSGKIKVAQRGSLAPTVFIDLSSKILIPQPGDERGLLGLAFHPNFSSNGKFYVNYIRAGDGATVVSEFTTVTRDGQSNNGDLSSERIILTIGQPYPTHNGGMIEFGPDGYLYIGMGDGGGDDDPDRNGQNPTVLLGKMLRIDVDVPQGSQDPYSIPATNPFTGLSTIRCDSTARKKGTCQEIWGIGLRNPWRFSFDRRTGQLWVADVGQAELEEIDDMTTGGGNYGWRVYEGDQCTDWDPELCSKTGFINPVFEYRHEQGRCAITGGYVYRGAAGTLPEGAYIFADYCSGEIWTLQDNVQTLLVNTSNRIVSFGEDEDGELYVCNYNGTIDKIVLARTPGDLDGDLKTDVAVYRPSSGVWYAVNSSDDSFRIQQFGVEEDIPAPADFDGDFKTDIAVFRPSNGVWYYFRSSDETVGIIQFGLSGDVPVPGDYDGDGKADLAVFRPSTGLWYELRSSDGRFSAVQFGLNQDIPTPGDYDGDGKTDISVWRPSSQVWYRLNSSDEHFSAIPIGSADGVPAPADFDGDGRTDPIVFEPSAGSWSILHSTDSVTQTIGWGIADDVPVIGDYDGDGKADVAVFRPSTGVWYILKSSDTTLQALQFGVSTDEPAPRYEIR